MAKFMSNLMNSIANGFPQQHHHHHHQPAPTPVMAPPQTQTQTQVMAQPCIKCHGNGFVHESNMSHDKPKDAKCFFCTSCGTCNGSGVLQNTVTTTYQQPTHGFHGHYGHQQPSQVVANMNTPCIKCHGHGFIHESNMSHDKPKDTKCFFCTSCGTCNGSGLLQNTVTTITSNNCHTPYHM